MEATAGVFTSFYGLFGQAAPTLWMITARAGGILGLAGVFRLSLELTDRAGLPRWSGWVAGIVGCLGLIMTAPNIDGNWPHNFFRGTVEPSMIAAWLWAVDAILRRRHLLAYTLVAAEGLMRPEAWLFLFAYGVWLWFTHPRLRVWVVICLVAQPVAWFLPTALSTGHPFTAAQNAHEFNGELGPHWLRALLLRSYHLQSLPTLVFAAVASLIVLSRQRANLAFWRVRDRVALRRSRDSLALSLVALTVAWWLIVIVETAAGFPGLQRFFYPATATACVLSGLGFVEIMVFAGRFAGNVLGGPRVAGTGGRGLAAAARSLPSASPSCLALPPTRSSRVGSRSPGSRRHRSRSSARRCTSSGSRSERLAGPEGCCRASSATSISTTPSSHSWHGSWASPCPASARCGRRASCSSRGTRCTTAG